VNFGATYADFFWWGGKVLFLCRIAHILNSALVLFASRRGGIYGDPKKVAKAWAISISTGVALAVSVLICVLGNNFYLHNVRPLKLAQSPDHPIFTDMDAYGTLWFHLVFIGWPLLLFLLAVYKQRHLGEAGQLEPQGQATQQ
jgi:hypothetical protein